MCVYIYISSKYANLYKDRQIDRCVKKRIFQRHLPENCGIQTDAVCISGDKTHAPTTPKIPRTLKGCFAVHNGKCQRAGLHQGKFQKGPGARLWEVPKSRARACGKCQKGHGAPVGNSNRAGRRSFGKRAGFAPVGNARGQGCGRKIQESLSFQNS